MHPVGTIIELYHKLQFCLPLNSVFVGEMAIPQKIQTEEVRGGGGGGEDIRFQLDLHFHVFFSSPFKERLQIFRTEELVKNF